MKYSPPALLDLDDGALPALESSVGDGVPVPGVLADLEAAAERLHLPGM